MAMMTRNLEIARDLKSLVIGVNAYLKIGTRAKPPNEAEFNGKVVLLSLGGRFGFPMLAKTLARLGFEVHVIARKMPGHEMQYAHQWHKADCLKDEKSVFDLVSMIQPVGVFSEMKNGLLPLKTKLQDHIGQRSIGSHAAKTSNSKLAFRESLDNAKLKNLDWEKYTPGRPVVISVPFVLKPDVGTGSRGVHLIRDIDKYKHIAQELKSRKQTVLFGGELLVEKFIVGRQFDIEGVSRDGSHYPLTITEEKYEHVGDLFPSLWYLFYPPISDQLEARLHVFAKQVISAAGVRNGAWHCELRLDQAGEIYPIDYSNRMGYPLMVCEASGENFLDLYVRSLLPGAFSPPNPEKHCVYQRFIKSAEERARFKTLASENPKSIIEFRKLKTVVADVTRYGRVSLRAKNYKEMCSLLTPYGLVPSEWSEMYGEP